MWRRRRHARLWASESLRAVFHLLTTAYLQPFDVVDQTRPAHLEWLGERVSAGRILLAGRTESQSGVVCYQRVAFNGAFRAPALSDG